MSEGPETSVERLVQQSLVDSRVDYHVIRLKEALTIILGWAWKLFAATLAIALFALGFFGFKTASDVKENARHSAETVKQDMEKLEADAKKAAEKLKNDTQIDIEKFKSDANRRIESQVDKQLKESKLAETYQGRLDDLYDRSLVTACLADVKSYRALYLTEGDFQRLRKIATRSSADAPPLDDDATLILLQANLPFNVDKPALIHELEIACHFNNSTEGRITAPKKLSCLFDNCSSDELESGARQVLSQNFAEKDQVLAAERYVDKTANLSAAPLIEQIRKRPQDHEVAQLSLVVLAHLAPASPMLTEYAENTLAAARKSELSLEDYVGALDVASRLVAGRFNSSQADTAEKLLNAVVAGGVRAYRQRETQKESSVFVKSRETTESKVENGDRITNIHADFRPLEKATASLLLPSSSILATMATNIAKAGSPKQLNDALRSLCLRDKNAVQETYVVVMVADFKDGSSLTLDGTEEISADKMLGPAFLLPQDNRDTPLVMWRDLSGKSRNKILVSFGDRGMINLRPVFRETVWAFDDAGH